MSCILQRRTARTTVASIRTPLSRSAMVAILGVTIAASRPAQAWDGPTTHAGLAEEAALASALHKKLVELGFAGGLFELLTIPPADAPDLLAAMRQLSPTHGTVPDSRGRMTALSWIAAGASIADSPAQYAANHFFDPTTKLGWRAPEASTLRRVRQTLSGRGDMSLPSRGVPAPDWVVDSKNPLGADGFWNQYQKAITASTSAERSRHMAAALVAAGAILHVLGDLGSPAHARADSAAFLEPLSDDQVDVGDRFDRIASLAFGRLGVPAPKRVVTRTSLRGFFTNAEGTGLADVTASRYFSSGTLPQPTAVATADGPVPVLVRPAPKVPRRLNLMAAARDEGSTLKDDRGVCLARYRVERNTLLFFLDDACMLEQAQVILPEVASFQTGLLDFLLRGRLSLRVDGGALSVSSEQNLGAGQLDILVEDARGVRTSLKSQTVSAVAASAELTRVGAPIGTKAIAVFRGKDPAGEDIVAVGSVILE
jgi:hypothetical protein